MKLGIFCILPSLLSFHSSPIKSAPVVLTNQVEEAENNEEEKPISKEAMLITILSVAAVGMTSIAIFYILKDKKMIK